MRKRRNRIRWHKFKCRVKNFILVTITVLAILMLIASLGVMVEQAMKSLSIFFGSLAWIVLFCHANGWLKECP